MAAFSFLLPQAPPSPTWQRPIPYRPAFVSQFLLISGVNLRSDAAGFLLEETLFVFGTRHHTRRHVRSRHLCTTTKKKKNRHWSIACDTLPLAIAVLRDPRLRKSVCHKLSLAGRYKCRVLFNSTVEKCPRQALRGPSVLACCVWAAQNAGRCYKRLQILMRLYL